MFKKKKKDPKEAAKAANRAVRSGGRDIEKELRQLDRQEKSLIIDIKKTARAGGAGNERAARALATQLVGLRNQREKLYQMRATFSAVGHRTSAMASQAAMADAVGSIAGVMKDVNDAMGAADVSKVMAQFAHQSEAMNLKASSSSACWLHQEDVINDALIDAFDGEAEEETDAVVNQVLEEVGLDIGALMQDAPMAGIGSKVTEGAAAQAEDEEAERLMAQLQQLEQL
ncbi:unnamed protein product [Chrysoparadoxa australica]